MKSPNIKKTMYRTGAILAVLLITIIAAFAGSTGSPTTQISQSNNFLLRSSSETRGLTLFMDVEEQKRQTKEIVSNLVSKNYEAVRKNFNEQMRNGLSADQIKQVWETLISQVGNYKGQDDPIVQRVQGYDTVTIRCRMEKGAIAVQVAFDSEEKVGGLWAVPTY